MATSAPINLELSLTGANHSNVKLEWLEPLRDPMLVIGYAIESSEDGSNWKYLVNNTNSIATRYIDRTITNGMRRYYRVRAISSTEISLSSNSEFIRVPKLPKPVTKIYADIISPDSLSLNWRYASDLNISHYEVRQKQGSHNSKTYLTLDPILDLINLLPDTIYKYEIRVKSKYGYSEWSAVVNTRTLRVPYAPKVYNKLDYIKGNKPLSWDYYLFKEAFKFSLTVGNNANNIYGYSISDSIGNTYGTVNLPGFLFIDNLSHVLTDFILDGTTLIINADSNDWLTNLSDYYFQLYSGSNLLDTFSVSDLDQEFNRDSINSKIRLTNYAGFDIKAYLNNTIDVCIYDINPDLTGNNSVPDIIDYQVEGSYNNINWHVLDSHIDGNLYDVYQTDPPLLNVRVAARNSVGLGDYG